LSPFRVKHHKGTQPGLGRIDDCPNFESKASRQATQFGTVVPHGSSGAVLLVAIR
jgi:hypothetical protein